jgi:transcription-repair coupling factor (superfamily II helicase)
MIILQDEDEMEGFIAELKIWTQNLDLHPYPFVHSNITTLEHAALLQQMKSIRAMLEPDTHRGAWITTLETLEAPCFALDFIDEPVLALELGQEFKMDELLAQLEQRGFQREDKVDQKGDFAQRGGILDVYPRFSQHPIRIEFFGDEIDSIREFSSVTQKSIRKLTRLVLDEMDYEKINDMKRDGSILDYLPEDMICLIQEPELIAKSRTSSDHTSGFEAWLLGESDTAIGLQKVSFARMIENPTFHFQGQLLDTLALSQQEAIDYLKENSQKQTCFLVEPFGSQLKLAEKGQLDIWSYDGMLEDSFEIPELNLKVFHENNLVQISDLQAEMTQADAMSDFVELEMGDYIVHENYGVGQFLGLTSMEKDGITNDFLLLQFAGGSKVYVPIAQLNLVQKYIGQGESSPELSRIGSKSWEMKKKKARKAIDRIVMELVHRQAFRESQNGFCFSNDTPEQRSFERAFPYNDTPCQTQATSSIKRDMESQKVMDHLLCGDVGFGKTEVAMRIAHKAMLDNKQVALLAPTTVLAEQHYNNFCERFKEHSDKIGVLTRFRGTKDSRTTLMKLAAGEIMILIGTHRLLSKDVDFVDLGMMILDEEQRFGVKQKEALKKRYPNIDVLSLSATPIPRTLHLSMLGIRGISNLTLPPENRHPIRTYLRERNKGIIIHAIHRELQRGGQSYFLHNRIEDIEEVKEELKSYFPTARIGIGHGQMKEKELSAVMKAFYALEIDIFLSTSIVANGIDIPTANTMLVNDAHMFGLSELHQIRGRIGRYSIQAYCYLLLPPGAKLPTKSMRRLRAIEEHQDLGAGFKLAMRDMEIRGVGNILGEDQHGQIADIGYELYTQYLSQAISEMKGQAPQSFIETELSWPIGSTYFPKSFIPSHSDRIDFYRKISFAKTNKQLDSIQRELRDRFGIFPKATEQMLLYFRIKVKLRQAGIKSLQKKDNGDSALIQTFNWNDDQKLKWVLANPKQLAFYRDTHIILKVDAIWDTIIDAKVELDPYMKYSYYNEDNRPDPLEVLDVLAHFITSSLEELEQKKDTEAPQA